MTTRRPAPPRPLVANPQHAPRVHAPPRALSSPVSPLAKLPDFRATPQVAYEGPTKDLGTSSPNVSFFPDGKGEMAARQQPAGLSTTGVQSVYTTSKRWRAVDVYIDVGALSIPGVNDASLDYLLVAVFAIVQGVRVQVASGRISAFEISQGTTKKHIVHYRSGQAEKFEVVYAISAVPSDPATNVKFAIIATDEASSPSAPDDDEAGTVHLGPIGTPGANRSAMPVTTGISAELRGFVASSSVALTAATPRWVHVYDLAANAAAPAATSPILSFPLMNGGGYFKPEAGIAWRFLNGIYFVLSSTAFLTTAVAWGSEDSAVQRVSFR